MRRFGLAVLIAIAALVPRTFSLDRVATFDETLWLQRARAFTSAIGEARFADTVRSGHPGVTTMWIAGLAQQTLPPGAGVRARLARSRVGMAVAASALIGLSWLIALGLIGGLASTVSAMLLALDPFLIAHNRLVHIDGLLALAALASFLALMRAVRGGNRRWLIASGALAGVAALTKVAAGFLIVVAVVALLRSDRATAARRIALWLGCAAGIMVLLWPAFWVAPWKPVARMVVGAGGAASGNPGGRLLGGGPVIDAVFFYPATVVWRTTLLTLPALAGTTIWAFRRRDEGREAATLLLFALGFLVFTAIGLKRADRYALPSLVAADVAVAVALARVMQGRSRAVAAAAVAGVLALHAAPGLAAHPYEIASYNWAAGGPSSARRVFALGFGEGLDEMAAELNRLPGASSLTVGSTHLTPLRELFDGRTVRLQDSHLARTGGERVDLVLFYISSVQTDRYRDAAVFAQFENESPLRTVWINGIPYVRVYRAPQR